MATTKMVGGANSYYHSDTETFVHVTIGKQPLKLEAGRPIWVTRSTDPHAPIKHKADEDLYPHYFKLVKKAKLFLLSGADGKFTDSIKRQLHDFINQRPNDKDKADLKEELEEVFDDAAPRGNWTTGAGADYRLVLFMRKILPKNENYDGFVRDIKDEPVTETEICFFDQTILREVPRPPGDSKAQASLRQGMRDAAKEEVVARQAARAAWSVQIKKARDEAAQAALDAQDRGEAAPAAPAAVVAPLPGSGGAGDGEGVKKGEGKPGADPRIFSEREALAALLKTRKIYGKYFGPRGTVRKTDDNPLLNGPRGPLSDASVKRVKYILQQAIARRYRTYKAIKADHHIEIKPPNPDQKNRPRVELEARKELAEARMEAPPVSHHKMEGGRKAFSQQSSYVRKLIASGETRGPTNYRKYTARGSSSDTESEESDEGSQFRRSMRAFKRARGVQR